jgi:alkane 1-monooxygenase
LPNGYFGAYLLAYVPWLWYRVMDKRLLALEHIKGDLTKINIDPDNRDAIYRKYGQSANSGEAVTD